MQSKLKCIQFSLLYAVGSVPLMDKQTLNRLHALPNYYVGNRCSKTSNENI